MSGHFLKRTHRSLHRLLQRSLSVHSLAAWALASVSFVCPFSLVQASLAVGEFFAEPLRFWTHPPSRDEDAAVVCMLLVLAAFFMIAVHIR